MSLYDYEESKKIAEEDPSFASLIIAAAWKADTLVLPLRGGGEKGKRGKSAEIPI